MKSHDLARQLLSLPNVEVGASVDVPNGTDWDHKCMGYSVIGVYDLSPLPQPEVVIHFKLGDFYETDSDGVMSDMYPEGQKR